jgi:hypothetical protein
MCNRYQEIECFIKNNKILKTCLNCRNYQSEWRNENKKRIANYKKEYYKIVKYRILTYQRNYYLTHKKNNSIKSDLNND